MSNSSKTCPDIDYHQELVGACLFCRWLPSDEQIKRLQGTGTQPYTQSDQEWANKPQLSTQQRGDNQPITSKSAKTGEPKEAKPAHEHESQLLPCKCGAWWNGESWGEATALSQHDIGSDTTTGTPEFSNVSQSSETPAKTDLLKLLNTFKYTRGSRFTEKQMDIARFVLEETERTGVNPPIDEVAKEFSLARSTTSQHLKAIRDKINKRIIQANPPQER